MQHIPISFDYKERHYDGYFQQVRGAGANVWYLMVNNCYSGTLMYTDKWVFHCNSNEMKELAELFGERVSLWYE